MKKFLANPLSLFMGLILALFGVFSISLPAGNAAAGAGLLVAGSTLIYLTQRQAARRKK